MRLDRYICFLCGKSLRTRNGLLRTYARYVTFNKIRYNVSLCNECMKLLDTDNGITYNRIQKLLELRSAMNDV